MTFNWTSGGKGLMEGFSCTDKFFAILEKYILNVSAISSSLNKVTPISIKFVVSLRLVLSE